MKKILILLCLLSTKVFSQDTLITLESVLVSSIRADKRSPITQKTISDTSIQKGYQGQEIPVLLSNLPSMSSYSDGGHAQGYSYLSLRGASQSRINMTLNGIPLNEPEDHGVYTSNFPSFINAIQSIQIQRGVGTSSNGTASFIGSINFQSKSGIKKGSDVQIGVGSYNTMRFNLSTSSGLSKKKMALFANIGGLSTDGFRHNSGSRGGSIFIGGGYYGNKRITRLTLFSGISKNYMAWEGSSDSSLSFDYKDNPRGDDNPDLFTQTHIQAQNINIFKRSKLTSTLFFNYLKGHYDVYNKKDLSLIGYYANENQNSNWIGYVTQYDYRIVDLRFSTGISANTYTRNHKGIEFYDDTTSFEYKNSGNKKEISAFVKLSYDISGVSYYADAQIRYVNFRYNGDVDLRKQSWLFFNPKTGIKILVNDKLDIYYTIGISHKEPTRSVMFNGGLYLTQFNDVKPEEVLDQELGINFNNARFKIQANAFYMLFKNEIIPIGTIGSNSLPTMTNVNKSVRYGIESDLEYRISNYITYIMNTTLSINTYGDNKKYQIFSPNFMLNHQISYKNSGFSLDIKQTCFSKSYMDLDNRNTTPGYSIFGIDMGYEFNGYKISLQGNNLLNKKYYRNGYVINNTKYLYPNALSNYYFTIKKFF